MFNVFTKIGYKNSVKKLANIWSKYVKNVEYFPIDLGCSFYEFNILLWAILQRKDDSSWILLICGVVYSSASLFWYNMHRSALHYWKEMPGSHCAWSKIHLAEYNENFDTHRKVLRFPTFVASEQTWYQKTGYMLIQLQILPDFRIRCYKANRILI